MLSTDDTKKIRPEYGKSAFALQGGRHKPSSRPKAGTGSFMGVGSDVDPGQNALPMNAKVAPMRLWTSSGSWKLLRGVTSVGTKTILSMRRTESYPVCVPLSVALLGFYLKQKAALSPVVVHRVIGDCQAGNEKNLSRHWGMRLLARPFRTKNEARMAQLSFIRGPPTRTNAPLAFDAGFLHFPYRGN